MLYRIAGVIALGLGALGIVLPLLPTTCFVLLAAWCFARSSRCWHQRLLNSKLFGSIIKQWELHRCISSNARGIALLSMLLSGLYSLLVLPSLLLKLSLVALLVAASYYLLSIKTCTLET